MDQERHRDVESGQLGPQEAGLLLERPPLPPIPESITSAGDIDGANHHTMMEGAFLDSERVKEETAGPHGQDLQLAEIDNAVAATEEEGQHPALKGCAAVGGGAHADGIYATEPCTHAIVEAPVQSQVLEDTETVHTSEPRDEIMVEEEVGLGTGNVVTVPTASGMTL